MAEVCIPVASIKGRGAASSVAHRFATDARTAFDDGWGTLCADHSSAPSTGAPITSVTPHAVGKALSRNDSPDIHFDYGLNPYRGCEHGCVYCYARPTHSYLNLSPGLEFETRIFAKTGIADALARELQSPRYVPSQIVIGSATDAYQPAERQWKITRSVIELLSRCDHPLAIVTKGSGVERDIDLLAPMARRNLAAVYVTITTLDGALARALEPRAAAPHRRLRTIRALADAGIPVGVSVAPQIPFINDDMEKALQAAAPQCRDRGCAACWRLRPGTLRACRAPGSRSGSPCCDGRPGGAPDGAPGGAAPGRRWPCHRPLRMCPLPNAPRISVSRAPRRHGERLSGGEEILQAIGPAVAAGRMFSGTFLERLFQLTQ